MADTVITSRRPEPGLGLLSRVLLWLIVICGGIFAAVYLLSCLGIILQSHRDEARKADAIVVFGAAEYSGKPSPVFRARLDHGLTLYRAQLAPVVITTGGTAWDPTYSEGGVGRDYLAKQGIDDQHLIAETYADNTAESAERVAIIMRANHMNSCVAVSDPYHVFRIKKMMEAQGIKTYTSPRPQPGMGLGARMGHIVREAFSYTLWKLHLRFLVPAMVDQHFHRPE